MFSPRSYSCGVGGWVDTGCGHTQKRQKERESGGDSMCATTGGGGRGEGGRRGEGGGGVEGPCLLRPARVGKGATRPRRRGMGVGGERQEEKQRIRREGGNRREGRESELHGRSKGFRVQACNGHLKLHTLPPLPQDPVLPCPCMDSAGSCVYPPLFHLQDAVVHPPTYPVP